jgi:polyisoprenyl-phosphate glycosyltransferase
MKLSIIIPVFKGGRILRELYKIINESLLNLYDYEVLFVCDGCDSESWSVIKELDKQNSSKIKVYRLAQNYGQHRAIQFGFSKVSGDLVVTIDEDLQHDPADIIRLIDKQKDGDYDIVYGRFIKPQHNSIKNIFSVVLRKSLKHFIPTLYENYSPYRLMKRDIAKKASTMVSSYTFIDDFLSRITQNIAFEDINHHKRIKGKSSYTFMKLLKHGISILLTYSKLIPFLYIISIAFVIIGSVMFALHVILLNNLDTKLINNKSIIEVMGIGSIFIILSLIASIINHWNTNINSKPIKLLNEDSI